MASVTAYQLFNKFLSVNTLEEKLQQTEQNLNILQKQRDSLNVYITSQESQMLAKDNLIEFFKLKDESLQNKLDNINIEIKSLNNKYEKATHITDHYTTDSIVLYFSKYDRLHYKTAK